MVIYSFEFEIGVDEMELVHVFIILSVVGRKLFNYLCSGIKSGMRGMVGIRAGISLT